MPRFESLTLHNYIISLKHLLPRMVSQSDGVEVCRSKPQDLKGSVYGSMFRVPSKASDIPLHVETSHSCLETSQQPAGSGILGRARVCHSLLSSSRRMGPFLRLGSGCRRLYVERTNASVEYFHGLWHQGCTQRMPLEVNGALRRFDLRKGCPGCGKVLVGLRWACVYLDIFL